MKEKKQLSEKDLENTSGGWAPDCYDSYGYYHVNCGGYIENVLNPFSSCHCCKCDETHYFANQFNKYEIIKEAGYWYRKYDDGTKEQLSGRPEELDWPCNQ